MRLQSHLRMQSITKFVLDLKHMIRPVFQSIQKALISIISIGISSQNTLKAYQSSVVKVWLEYSVFCIDQFLWSRKAKKHDVLFNLMYISHNKFGLLLKNGLQELFYGPLNLKMVHSKVGLLRHCPMDHSGLPNPCSLWVNQRAQHRWPEIP